ncbi:hypothetical protein [Phytohabitans sp. LJ34]
MRNRTGYLPAPFHTASGLRDTALLRDDRDDDDLVSVDAEQLGDKFG